MTTQYAEEQGFKKKYLAPLIVLMLCAVSLTGAAYAYSTSVTNSGTIEGDYYSIDIYNTSGEVITESFKFADDFDVQTTKTVGSNYFAKTISKNTTEIDGKQYLTFTYIEKVKVQSNEDVDTYVSGTATYTNKSASSTFYDAWSDAAAVKCSVAFCATEDGTYDLTKIKTNEFYYAQITVNLLVIDETLGTADPNQISTLLTFDGAKCLEVVLTATDVDPSA
jgi:hypothetical protein